MGLMLDFYKWRLMVGRDLTRQRACFSAVSHSFKIASFSKIAHPSKTLLELFLSDTRKVNCQTTIGLCTVTLSPMMFSAIHEHCLT